MDSRLEVLHRAMVGAPTGAANALEEYDAAKIKLAQKKESEEYTNKPENKKLYTNQARDVLRRDIAKLEVEVKRLEGVYNEKKAFIEKSREEYGRVLSGKSNRKAPPPRKEASDDGCWISSEPDGDGVKAWTHRDGSGFEWGKGENGSETPDGKPECTSGGARRHHGGAETPGGVKPAGGRRTRRGQPRRKTSRRKQ
jgi:hypothetical protein